MTIAAAPMIRPAETTPVVTGLLGFVAGFVDVAAFLGLFKIFVAQLTGSFVYAGAAIVSEHHEVMAVIAVPTFFLAGCMATWLALSRAAGGRPLVWVLALECALLTIMTVLMLELSFAGENSPPAVAAALSGIAAMGVQSAMVRMFMRGAPSTNVMTTNTSQLAIDATILVLSMRGRVAAEQTAESRDRFAHYWPPVAGFISGTALGALGDHIAGNFALGAPIVVAYALLGWAAWARSEAVAA